jgi:hypothetical protein
MGRITYFPVPVDLPYPSGTSCPAAAPSFAFVCVMLGVHYDGWLFLDQAAPMRGVAGDGGEMVGETECPCRRAARARRWCTCKVALDTKLRRKKIGFYKSEWLVGDGVVRLGVRGNRRCVAWGEP